VVYLILKDNFSTFRVAIEYNVPTLGGFANSEIEAGLIRIDGPQRLNIEAKSVDDTLLTEAERNVRQAQAGVPTVTGDRDPAQFRSLVDDSRELTLNGTWSTGFGEGGSDGSLSVNAAFTRNDSRALLGLDTVLLIDPGGNSAIRSLGDPLERNRRTSTVQGGATLNHRIGDWQLSATVDASHVDTATRVDQRGATGALVEAAAAGLLAIDGPLPSVASGGTERTRSKDLSVSSLLTLAGTPFRLPAGDASLTVRAGYDHDRSRNRDSLGRAAPLTLTRGDVSTGFNLGLPVTSRKEGVLGAIGDVSLNLSAGINHLSDFGSLTDWNAGITWNPVESLSLQASYIVNEAAPSLGNLGSPELAVFNVPVYDFSLGQTALVTIISGGNPNLRKETQRDLKLSANWDLPVLERSNLIFEYFRNRSDNVTRSFPLLTPEIEAAFPERVTRVDGNLTQIDRRPVTFDRASGSRIRWGLNLSGRIGADIRSAGSGPPSVPGSGGTAPSPASGGQRFDPARFAALREKLCGSDAAPDISALPEDMQVRLRNPDGSVDAERLARMKQRICAAQAEGGAGAGFDPDRMSR
ncbi:MAG: TonB-dependent receptor, partial [Novosphingobium sp.]|nr:TonB-dependent receptor [Novosphingobium sp.]